MKIFECYNCKNTVFFENTLCESCGNTLGYLESGCCVISKPPKDTFFVAGHAYKYCNNFQHGVCNWLVASLSEAEFCSSCETNNIVPDLSVPGNKEKWRRIEVAKHRLVYSVLKLGLPLVSKTSDPEGGLYFDFKGKELRASVTKPVRTGHQNGLITLNIDEADPVHREFMKREMHEPYRTLIGHFRHEIGHYYWQLLIYPYQQQLAQFRSMFGNETQDYGKAIELHYKNGAPAGWKMNYISEYATSHPWEDWAETWAHYIHMVDTLETAYTYGISVNPRLTSSPAVNMEATFDPYQERNFDRIIEAYTPLSSAVNSLNRSMGQPDLYPFTFNPTVVNKLRFIHSLMK